MDITNVAKLYVRFIKSHSQFAKCRSSLAAVTPVIYEGDVQWLASLVVILEKRESNGNEKICLATPTTDLVEGGYGFNVTSFWSFNSLWPSDAYMRR